MYQLHLKPLAPDLCTAVAIPLQYKFTDLSSNEHLVQIDNIYQLVQSGVIYQSVTISINLDFITKPSNATDLIFQTGVANN